MGHYDGIETWLATEFGPQVPIPIEKDGPSFVSLWKLTRGLPLRSPQGALLAQSRRSLASQIIRENTAVESIAELDSMNRVMFLTPYTTQTHLTAFNLSNTLPHSDDKAIVIVLRDPFSRAPAEPSTISFLAPGTRTTGKFAILLTVRPVVID